MRSGRRRPTRDDLEHGEGRIRLADLAPLVGFSRQKLLADAHAGLIQVTWMPCGQRRIAMIDRAEGLRYLDGVSSTVTFHVAQGLNCSNGA